MTIDAAYAALIEANPIPDAEAYAEHRLASAVFLTATRERTATMTITEDQEATNNSKQKKWRPLAAVAAFVLVLALGAAALLTLNDGTDAVAVPAPPFETPEEAVEAYYTVLEQGDTEAYPALFAADASDGNFDSGGIATEAKIRARVEAAGFNTYTVEECVAETDRRAKCTIRFVAPWFGPILGEATAAGFGEIAVLTIDEAGWISRIGIVNGPIDIENRELIDGNRTNAWDIWITDKSPDLLEEWRFQLWGSDAIERSGAEIVRDYLAAAEEFAAQYGG
jgi:hypothetical protein